MGSIAGKPPRLVHASEVDGLSRVRRTLRQHYRRKRRHYGVDRPDFYDRDLRRLFSDAPEFAGNVTAAAFVTRIRARCGGWCQLDRHLSVHDRPGAGGHHRPVPGLETASRGARGHGPPRIHRAAHGAGHELPAQRAAPAGAMKKLRILALVHKHWCLPTTRRRGRGERRMEDGVRRHRDARREGHEVLIAGVHDDLTPIRSSIDEFRPDIVFNLLEGFATSHVRSERRQLPRAAADPYTGCNPRASSSRGTSRWQEAAHLPPRARPGLHGGAAGARGQADRLRFPLIVKSLVFEASIGISQASVVENQEQLARRVQFVHESLGTARSSRSSSTAGALRGRHWQRSLRAFRSGRCRSPRCPSGRGTWRPSGSSGARSTRRSTAS